MQQVGLPSLSFRQSIYMVNGAFSESLERYDLDMEINRHSVRLDALVVQSLVTEYVIVHGVDCVDVMGGELFMVERHPLRALSKGQNALLERQRMTLMSVVPPLACTPLFPFVSP